jgi:hypothetical protein
MGCRNLFEFVSRISVQKSRDLKMFKLNLNWIQTKINSNQYFEGFSNWEILEIGLNIQI